MQAEKVDRGVRLEVVSILTNSVHVREARLPSSESDVIGFRAFLLQGPRGELSNNFSRIAPTDRSSLVSTYARHSRIGNLHILFGMSIIFTTQRSIALRAQYLCD